mmetsp:Transcript_29586/g.78331  ORF Transcript_29586/g.78331 Transcript_29586/m.78331 type:complete len:471 (+) Transcript_29586:81-1493(+)
MFDARGALRSESQSPRHYGAGTGVCKGDLTLGLPLSGAGADLSWVAGKRHYSPSPGPVTPRTKAEIFQGHGGYPLSGQGADISFACGKRNFPTESKLEFGAASPRRSKIEALHGLPMAGRDADITLAGGRRQFAQAHAVTTRGESAPPCPVGMRNQTFADEHLLRSRALIGRGLGSPTRAAAEKARELRSERRRSASPGCGTPGSEADLASPMTPVWQQPSRTGPRMPRKSAPAKLSAVTLDILASSQRLKKVLSHGHSTSTIVGDDDCDSTVMGSTLSSGSLCSVLVNSITSARTIQDVSHNTPEGSTFRDALAVSLKDQMETAWAILSSELRLGSDGKKCDKSFRPRVRRSSNTTSNGSGSIPSQSQTPSTPPVAKTVGAASHQRMSSGSKQRSSESLCSFVLAPGAGPESPAADGLAGSTYMSSMSTSSLVIPESTVLLPESRVMSCGSLPEQLKGPGARKNTGARL